MAHEEQYVVHTAMRASELRERARQFADELALRLEQINQDYGPPQGMSPEQLEELQAVERAHGGRLPGPTPLESRALFASLFCDYIAEHYVIVPDEFTSETPASQSTPRGGVVIPRRGNSGLIVEPPGTVVEFETMRP